MGRRGRGVEDLSVTYRVQIQDLRSQKRRLAPLAAALAEVLPAEIAERTTLMGLQRGVLEIGVADSGTRFELDRFLRSGGEAALLRLIPVAVRRVRVVWTREHSPESAGRAR